MTTFTLPNEVQSFITDLSHFQQVEAIMLGGSKSVGVGDASSDYDFYIYYGNELMPAEQRIPILQKHCSYFEPNNTFWETEDNGTLNCGTDFDIVYRHIDDFFGFARQKQSCVASVGYSTCLWANVMNSVILYDKSGEGQRLKDAFGTDYPDALAKAIISKNMALITGTMPAYDKQIAKAVKRGDIVNVHNRIDAFLASYFDILFALNRIPHPGEKRMVPYLKQQAHILPENFEENLTSLLNCSPSDERIIGIVADMAAALKKNLEKI